ncbi:orotidine-5'-phosphate decarboxylase [Oceanobacillus piezotolerans]|uniref:Orotidine 5'-phosphate decarboxylase n=1 Tax=Oceanobacillus piezotolerans TaxID=2448030 RepID=A0A498DB63_9BACI|nr:orotidine-5'-phosphate decarboxylase [Oceanobacillus piezotolerans]RLL45260.1 orotidine-5'-phosphate decarboxylase [Oceanobacillus piezotolerans]
MTQAIYVALDFPNWKETCQFLTMHDLQGVPVKVGMELFYREGPLVIEKLKSNNHPIFLDLKLHDIPTTVGRTMKNLASLDIDLVNVHAFGGSEMIKRAKEGLGSSNTKLVAVTVLTSMDNEILNKELMIPSDVNETAQKLALLANKSGADGVVCSVHEAEQIKSACGKDFITVTPGIRLEGFHSHDQKRVATPKYASEHGADILVIGRSITGAEDPKRAYSQALKECGLNDIK